MPCACSVLRYEYCALVCYAYAYAEMILYSYFASWKRYGLHDAVRMDACIPPWKKTNGFANKQFRVASLCVQHIHCCWGMKSDKIITLSCVPFHWPCCRVESLLINNIRTGPDWSELSPFNIDTTYLLSTVSMLSCRNVQWQQCSKAEAQCRLRAD